ncbi:hypothetical protein BD626DRAFT_565896 [Schizophyllum amplum]|uniref:Uncharacterized protein n=1 Tax=Schizophyllum amplum TaxID=97359 RepID=A0A550CPV8_9AGAR|nr:hypothetical protein BD626DRAFT_565896 [Auriculariopsis ampla]
MLRTIRSWLAPRQHAEADLEKEQSWACRGEVSVVSEKPDADGREMNVNVRGRTKAKAPALLRKPSLADLQRHEHAEERALTRSRSSRSAWLHPRPRRDRIRRGASLDGRLDSSGSLREQKRPLRLDTVHISHPTPVGPGSTGSLTGIDLPSPVGGKVTVRRSASLPARLPAGPPPSAFRAPDSHPALEERLMARLESGVSVGGGGSAGVEGGGLRASGSSRVRTPDAAMVRPVVARPPVLSAIEERSYRSPALSFRLLPASSTKAAGSPVERGSNVSMDTGRFTATGRMIPHLVITPSSPPRSPIDDRDVVSVRSVFRENIWGVVERDDDDEDGPHADSYYDDTLASPHADSFVTAGSDRYRRSSGAFAEDISATAVGSHPSRTGADMRSYTSADPEKGGAEITTLDVVDDEEMMRRIEHRWSKSATSELPVVLTVPRAREPRRRPRWTPAMWLFFSGFLFPALWLIGGWLFTLRGELPFYRLSSQTKEASSSGKPAFSCLRRRQRRQTKELVLPKWRARANSIGAAYEGKELRRTGTPLAVICRYPFVEQRVVADVLTSSEAGPDAISVSARPEWTRRVIDPWIVRCRLALWYFSVLLFFGSALAIVILLVSARLT